MIYTEWSAGRQGKENGTPSNEAVPEQSNVSTETIEEETDQPENTVKQIYLNIYTQDGEPMTKRINSLQALLEYAHRLPWGIKDEYARLTLNETITEITNHQQVDSPAESTGRE